MKKIQTIASQFSQFFQTFGSNPFNPRESRAMFPWEIAWYTLANPLKCILHDENGPKVHRMAIEFTNCPIVGQAHNGQGSVPR